MLKKISCIILLLSLSISYSYSSNNFYISVTVNEKIITNFDIEKESKYLKILSPNLITLDNKKIFNISKNSLINEIIKKSEIQKYLDFKKDNLLVNDYLENLYKKLNFIDEKSFENFLLREEIYTLTEIKEKLKIEVMWNELIYLKYSDQVKINNNLLLEKIDKLQNKTINDYLLAEIVFNKKKNESLDSTIKKINSSIVEIGFENTANILSKSDSSKQGGNIGWVSEQNLSDLILNELKNIDIGQHTNVIQIANNFLFLKIVEKKSNKISIDKDEELKKMVNFETNKQLNQFSRIYFDKAKINYSINEK
jgi:peptidyl-prolyl cis-trans isomerase SurA